MNNVVKYMCKQLDKRYSDQNLFCTKELGENCIGISGYALNYLLCGFLYHNKPSDSQGISYRIKWVCENERLFPIIMCWDGQNNIQYIGTKAAEPGLFDCAKIGRQQCHKVEQESLYLKLEKTSKDSLNHEILSLESDIHDHYTVLRPKNQQCRKVLLSLVREARSSTQAYNMCSAQNCLLMFFSQEETSAALLQYLQSEQDEQKCRMVLSFLAKYCTFVEEFLPLYQDNMISPEFFRRHFFDYWGIELGTSLANGVIQQDGKSSGTADSFIPVIPFLSVSEFKDLISSCIHAASYKQRIRCIKQLRHALEERCAKDDMEVQKHLDVVDQYISQMQTLRNKGRHAS